MSHRQSHRLLPVSIVNMPIVIIIIIISESRLNRHVYSSVVGVGRLGAVAGPGAPMLQFMVAAPSAFQGGGYSLTEDRWLEF